MSKNNCLVPRGYARSLNYNPSKIVEMIRALIFRIHEKFPESKIINIGIKPSFERQKDLEVIKQINHMMREFSCNINYLNQVDLFEELMTNGNIDKKYFLQDGLHLNKQGYIVLNKLLHAELKILKV